MLIRFLELLFWLIFCDKTPVGLRKTFEKLGPTFIKLGQLLSARPDFIPKAYTEEFRKLLDKELEVDYSEIKTILEVELGEGKLADFISIDEHPISSASIGQVHVGVLKNKKKVAIKVMKPGIKKYIQADTKILLKIADFLSLSQFFRSISIKKVIQEYSLWISRELDFNAEAQRAIKLSENLEKYEHFVIPKVYREYTTEKVLVLEYLDGITVNEILNQMQNNKVDDPKKIKLPFKVDYEVLVSQVIDCYVFKQILTDSYFHGDPHPANILVLPGNKIGLVDFGIMGTLDQKEHNQILMVLLGIVEDDPTRLLHVMAAISEKEFTRKESLEVADTISEELHKMHAGNLRDATIGEMILNIITVGRNYNLHWSPGIILGLRAIAIIEGIGLRVIPNASLIELIKPHLRKYLAHVAVSQFSEDEIYKGMLKLMEFGRAMENVGDLFGDKGLKVEVAKEVNNDG